MSIYATRVQLVEATGYKQARAQIRALVTMRVPFRVAPDGRPRVLMIDLAPAGSSLREDNDGTQAKEPNWSAVQVGT